MKILQNVLLQRCFLVLLIIPFSASQAQLPLHPDRGVALIWYGNQDNLNTREGIVTTGQIFYMWKWFEPTEGNYTFNDLDEKLQQIHSKGMKTTIQINANIHPDYLFSIIPYLKGIVYPTTNDHENGFGPLMYWHPVYKEKYQNMIRALAIHLKNSPYKEVVLGIRQNYNAIGTEHHYIRLEHRDKTLWTLEEGATWSDEWPWTDQVANQYMTWAIDMFLEEFNPPSDINVFLRAEAVSRGVVTQNHLNMIANGDVWLFHTSSEPQPRSGKNNQFNVFVDYAKTGKTYAFMESWSAANTFSDGWGWTKTNSPITKAQFNYWTLLCNLHCGATLVAMRPQDVDVPEYREDYEFCAKYAGYIAHPKVAPGAWIAFREGDFLVGDYTFLMRRHPTDNSQPLYNVDNEKYGLWARRVQTLYPMKVLLDTSFTSSLINDTIELRIRYKDEGHGFFEVNAFGQTYQYSKYGTGKWEVARQLIKVNSIDNEIEIKAIDNALIIHMVEVLREPGDFINEPVTGVSPSSDSATIAVGISQKFYANVLPSSASNKRVTWSSSDDDVAEVGQDGTVLAKSEGTAIITLITEDGNFSAEIYITVVLQYVEDFMDSLAQDWILNGNFLISIGKLSTTHTAAFCRGIYDGLIFNSPYTYEIDFLGSGTATATTIRIIFNYQDNNNYYYVEFTGGANGTASLKKIIDGTITTIAEYGNFVTSNILTRLEIKFSTNGITVLATKGNEQTILFDNVQVTLLKSGKIGIATSYNNVHFSNIKVTYSETGLTAINKKLTPEMFIIFPNPSANLEFTIEMSQVPGIKNLEIYNVLGELIHKQQLSGDENFYKINAGKAGRKGLYLVSISGGNWIITKKLIVM